MDSKDKIMPAIVIPPVSNDDDFNGENLKEKKKYNSKVVDSLRAGGETKDQKEIKAKPQRKQVGLIMDLSLNQRIHHLAIDNNTSFTAIANKLFEYLLEHQDLLDEFIDYINKEKEEV